VRLTERLADLAPAPRGSVVSIGVFDGVHLGHQAILRANLARAIELGAEPTLVTFQGHPKQLLLGRAPKSLTSLQHRLHLFERLGIAHTVALPFDAELRALDAAEFTRRVLLDGLGCRHAVLGFDSKFGRGAEGNPESLRRLGLAVDVVGQVLVRHRPVSSTAIREAIELGDLEAAAAMLGRPVALYGDVVHGDALGRTLGFPTANLDLHAGLHPPPGVYAARARRGAEREPGWPAVVNIGVRPTLAQAGGQLRIEVHLIDWSGDLYGASLEVELLERLRGEQRFPDLAALAAQVQQDVARARRLLAEREKSLDR
jgi:riboflavin kinase/FMN adenylyltransferase